MNGIYVGAAVGRRRLSLGIATALVAVVAALSVAGPALATPTGEYKVFAQCPLTHANVTACLYATTSSGEFTVGTRTVPIKKAITLQGAIATNPETGAQSFVGAVNGETLSKTPQTVPGGLIGIEGLGGEVTATTELAAPAAIGISEANLLDEEGAGCRCRSRSNSATRSSATAAMSAPTRTRSSSA